VTDQCRVLASGSPEFTEEAVHMNDRKQMAALHDQPPNQGGGNRQDTPLLDSVSHARQYDWSTLD